MEIYELLRSITAKMYKYGLEIKDVKSSYTPHEHYPTQTLTYENCDIRIERYWSPPPTIEFRADSRIWPVMSDVKKMMEETLMEVDKLIDELDEKEIEAAKSRRVKNIEAELQFLTENVEG